MGDDKERVSGSDGFEHDDDDVPMLSNEARLALAEFYEETLSKQKQLNALSADGEDVPVTAFSEDWQLSQFWYDERTTEALSTEISRAAGPSGKVALISCPSLFKKVKEKLSDSQVTLFEFDKRFSVYGSNFHLYDYKNPLDVPKGFSKCFDVVAADPPFLSEDCLTKTAVTIKYLAKDKIILCTGAIMGGLAEKLLKVKECKFVPHHQNNLANEFSCFANYNFDDFLDLCTEEIK